MDFVYWRHPSVPGIKIEEITGGEHYKGQVWLEMARQLYCENGREAYREIGHFNNGAPFLYGESSRISITHCSGLLAVATLPDTPEVSLGMFSERTAMGIDAERADRRQVLNVRRRFLSDDELAMIPADGIEPNVIAWTVKEAAYKAAFIPGLDFRENIRIRRMPRLAPPTPVFDPLEYGLPAGAKEIPEDFFGEVVIVAGKNGGDGGRAAVPDSDVVGQVEKDGSLANITLRVYSYMSDDFIVTLCYAPRCAKFGRSARV